MRFTFYVIFVLLMAGTLIPYRPSAQITRLLHYQDLKEVSFPSKIDATESKGVKFFYSNTSDFFFACGVSSLPKDDSLVHQKTLNNDLQLCIEGYFNSENWKYHNREQVDTIIGGAKGILVHGFKPSKPIRIIEFFNFFAIVNGTLYTIQGGATKELTPFLKEQIDIFFKSIKFDTTKKPAPNNNLSHNIPLFDNHKPFKILSFANGIERNSTDDDSSKCRSWKLTEGNITQIIRHSKEIDGTTWDLTFEVLRCIIKGALLQNKHEHKFSINAGSFIWVTSGDTTVLFGDYNKADRKWFLSKPGNE